jgi:photosystem II stability/assembly factor-like uncharacterized protein
MGGTDIRGQRLADSCINVPSVTRRVFRLAAVLLLGLSLLAALSAFQGGKHSAQPAQSAISQNSKPAQSTPASRVPNSIAFWDADHGLVGSGVTWKKTTGAISATSDGGKTFHIVLRTPGPVEWVSTAGSRDAWALVERCTPESCVLSRLLHSNDRGQSWHRASAIVWNPSFATARQGLALASGAVQGMRNIESAVPLVKTTNGGLSWTRRNNPCPRPVDFAAPYLSFPSPLRAWMVCVGQGGAGNEAKAIYASSDGGRNWRRLVDVPMTGQSGGLVGYGYPQGISFTPQGYGLLWESRGFLFLTRDGGRHWQKLAVAEPEVDSGLSAVMLSKTRAFVLLTREGRYRLLATTDGGRSWSVVQCWPAAH